MVGTITRAGGGRPGGTAPPGRFDLDDLGAEVGEKLSAVLTGNGRGQFDDSEAVQCRHD